MTDRILEVIVTSVSDAIQAKLGGANRLEVVRNLECGGLTPSLELVSAIQDAVDLPLRVMLRESPGFGVADETEVATLMHAAVKLQELRVDGVVIGFLIGRHLNTKLTERILKSAPALKATFHHAFEETGNKFDALSELKLLDQIDRVLSHGGEGTLIQRTRQLGEYADAAGPELTIIAGGGIHEDAIILLTRTTIIREFHVGRAARAGFSAEGEVKSNLVNRLAELVHGL